MYYYFTYIFPFASTSQKLAYEITTKYARKVRSSNCGKCLSIEEAKGRREGAVAVAQVKNLAKLYAMIGRKKWQSSYFWFAIGI